MDPRSPGPSQMVPIPEHRIQGPRPGQPTIDSPPSSEPIQPFHVIQPPPNQLINQRPPMTPAMMIQQPDKQASFGVSSDEPSTLASGLPPQNMGNFPFQMARRAPNQLGNITIPPHRSGSHLPQLFTEWDECQFRPRSMSSSSSNSTRSSYTLPESHWMCCRQVCRCVHASRYRSALIYRPLVACISHRHSPSSP